MSGDDIDGLGLRKAYMRGRVEKSRGIFRMTVWIGWQEKRFVQCLFSN
jgi:hypothetical protein